MYLQGKGKRGKQKWLKKIRKNFLTKAREYGII
jgi:hypothetical protein